MSDRTADLSPPPAGMGSGELNTFLETIQMALKVIKERSTGMYLAGDFHEVAFVDAERVSGENDATWLSTHDEQDLAVLASALLASDQFEVLNLSGCE